MKYLLTLCDMALEVYLLPQEFTYDNFLTGSVCFVQFRVYWYEI